MTGHGRTNDEMASVTAAGTPERTAGESALNAMDEAACLQTQGLSVGYDGKPLINDVDIVVQPGRIVTLIGPNGAGKSTILKSIAGYLEPLGGSVYLSGKPIGQLSAHELSMQLSVMLTERLRTELLTCADIVEMGRYPYTGRLGILSDDDRAVVRESMELVHVWDLRDRDFMQISDGQRQRILLARAICQQPRVIMLDEPTNYLDIHYQIELLNVLRRLVSTRNVGVIMSLHELPLARKVSDYVLCVKGDCICAQGTPEQIFTSQVIDELYDLEPGVYDPATGSIRLEGD